MTPLELATGVLKKSSRTALIAHITPDGDTIGSCLALARCLQKLGKNVTLYCQDPPPDMFYFLAGIDLFRKPVAKFNPYDIVVTLDCSDVDRLGDCAYLLEGAACTINIDHHITNTRYANINIVDSKAAATAEIVFHLIRNLTGDLDLAICEALYTAIVTDTGGFGFSNTTPNTHRISAELLEYGLDVDRLTTLIYRSNPVEKIKLSAKVLNTLELHFRNKVAFLTVTQSMVNETGADDNGTDGIINFAIDIIGIECAALFKELSGNRTKVSFRTKAMVDASTVASMFGGGGHKRAAGCIIEEGLERSKTLILEAVQSNFEE